MELIRNSETRYRIDFANTAHAPITVRPIFSDRVRYDTERARRNWPTLSDAPQLATGFIAYTAARRLHALPEGVETWDDFINEVADIANVTSDGREITWSNGRAYAEEIDGSSAPLIIADDDTIDGADPTTPATPAGY